MIWHAVRTVSDGRSIILIVWPYQEVYSQSLKWRGCVVNVGPGRHSYLNIRQWFSVRVQCIATGVLYLSDYWWAGVVEYLGLYRMFVNSAKLIIHINECLHCWLLLVWFVWLPSYAVVSMLWWFLPEVCSFRTISLWLIYTRKKWCVLSEIVMQEGQVTICATGGHLPDSSGRGLIIAGGWISVAYSNLGRQIDVYGA